METVQKEKGWPWLSVDAGNLLFKSNPIPPETLSQDKIKAEAIVTAYSLMGYTAVAVGPGDIVAGVDFLKEMEKKSSFVWLSSNLVSKKDGKPVFQSIITKKVGKTEVAILALTAQPMAHASLEEGYSLKPWGDVLPTLLEKATKSDMVILLSSLEPVDNHNIAKANPGIHLIIQAPPFSATNQPPQIEEGGAILTQTEQQGKSLGVIHISWEASKKWREYDASATLQEEKKELDSLNWQIDRVQSQGDPKVVFANNPAQLDAYRMLLEKKQQITGEIDRLGVEIKAEEKNKQSTFTSSFIAMETSLPDHPKVKELVEETKKKMNETVKTSVQPPVAVPGASLLPADFPYVGWTTCASCHPEAMRNWKASRHARAVDTLKAKNENLNLACITCHVTGLETGKEPYALQLSIPLQAVGCEVCHGPGRLHVQDPAKNHLIAKPGEERCRRCHTPEHDNGFDYGKKVGLLGYPLSKK